MKSSLGRQRPRFDESVGSSGLPKDAKGPPMSNIRLPTIGVLDGMHITVLPGLERYMGTHLVIYRVNVWCC
jgi:hypothetical protein